VLDYILEQCRFSGRYICTGNYLTKKFMPFANDWVDTLCALRRFPQISVTTFYMDGVKDKVFEITVRDFLERD
jgi:hypothetical protein